MATIYYVAASLDGFIADAEGGLDWLLAAGDPADVDPGIEDFMASVGATCMGASTYQWLLDHVPEQERGLDENTWVFTHRAFPAVGDVRFAAGDVRPVHQAMIEAAGDKNVWIMGGGDLAAQFYDAGLLDEVVLALMPTTLGAGAPLFPRAASRPWRLTSLAKGGAGAIVAHYSLR